MTCTRYWVGGDFRAIHSSYLHDCAARSGTRLWCWPFLSQAIFFAVFTFHTRKAKMCPKQVQPVGVEFEFSSTLLQWARIMWLKSCGKRKHWNNWHGHDYVSYRIWLWARSNNQTVLDPIQAKLSNNNIFIWRYWKSLYGWKQQTRAYTCLISLISDTHIHHSITCAWACYQG